MAQPAAPLSHPPIPRHRSPPYDQWWAFSSPSAVGDQGLLVAHLTTQRIAWTDDVHSPDIALRYLVDRSQCP
eukprot:5876839-Pyramimonas_sp.AAC.1